MKKTTKRLVSILMALVMMVGLLPVTALADEWAGVTLTATASDKSKKLVVGETFTVTISLSNNLSTGISGVYYDVGFSKEDFELLDKVDGKKKTVSEADVFYTEVEVGETVVKAAVQHSGNIGEANTTGSISPNVNAAANTNDYTYNANGKLLTMTFKIKDGATPGEKKFTISNVRTTQDGTDPKPGKGDGCSVTLTAATSNELPVTIAKPAKGDTPETTITGTNYTGSITWEPTVAAGGKFAANTEYTANVTLTAKEGYQFAEGVNPTVTNATSVTDKNVAAGGKTLTFKATFDKTGTATLTGIKIIDKIDGHALTVDVPHAAPNTTKTNTLTLAAASVYDDGTGGPVAATWEITNDPKLTGVSIDEATGKLTVDNTAAGDDVHVKAEFSGKTDRVTVTIKKDDPVESAIVLTAPTPATVAVPKSDTPNKIDLPAAAVYDQYGMPMTGTFTITYEFDGTTPTGVTLAPGYGKIEVDRTAQAGEVKVRAKLGTTLTSDPVAYTITRETSQVTSVHVYAPEYIMNVPKVTGPGATNKAYQQFDPAKVLDQYGQEMTGKTVTWNVADDTGNSVTGVSIDNNGKLTVTNEAPAITVYVTATCSGIESNKSKVTIKKETAKASLVEICNQVGEAPKTRLLIPAATFTNSEAYTAKVYDQYGVYMPGEMVDWELVPATVAGVELDTTTSTGNAILKVGSTATSGTTFKLMATSSTVTTVKGELEITVQKKTDVSSKINFNDGSLTYNGAGQTYEKATLDSSVTPGTGEKWTYTYAVKSGATGTLDAAGLPKTVGTYTVTATYEDSLNIGSKSVTLNITPRKVDIPAADNTVYTYDGTAKTYKISASADYTVNNATQTNANEGGYLVTVALKDEINTIWADGNTIVKHYTFKIMKATPTGEPAYTEITTSGKTLADANLTKGTITLDGTIKWNDAKTTVVEANKSYGWTFTPTDSTNYESINGSIKLWSKSTSSGGYYYAPTAAVVPDMPMLYRGCTGDAVKTLQDKLNALGYNSGNVDGIFGAKTYAAVTAFQKANSLGVDGIVGKLTWGKLYGVSPAMPVETTTVVGRPMVSYGSRGDAVRKLQELLNALGYDCGSVDGIFGSKTKAAVLAFQKANGLGVDGIVGPLTWAKLG